MQERIPGITLQEPSHMELPLQAQETYPMQACDSYLELRARLMVPSPQNHPSTQVHPRIECWCWHRVFPPLAVLQAPRTPCQHLGVESVDATCWPLLQQSLGALLPHSELDPLPLLAMLAASACGMTALVGAVLAVAGDPFVLEARFEQPSSAQGRRRWPLERTAQIEPERPGQLPHARIGHSLFGLQHWAAPVAVLIPQQIAHPFVTQQGAQRDARLKVPRLMTAVFLEVAMQKGPSEAWSGAPRWSGAPAALWPVWIELQRTAVSCQVGHLAPAAPVAVVALLAQLGQQIVAAAVQPFVAASGWAANKAPRWPEVANLAPFGDQHSLPSFAHH
mmetsp:Transcript_70207/g.131275  ORF Transcript_70207/g.131275 Transcript_70207/m.131275 type:complete len:335 (-) Transcript_70207:1589-2593(-)